VPSQQMRDTIEVHPTAALGLGADFALFASPGREVGVFH